MTPRRPCLVCGGGYATNDEPAKISCPCCQATLVIDRETLAILYVTEHRVKAGGASFEKSLQDLKDKEKQKQQQVTKHKQGEQKKHDNAPGKRPSGTP